MTWDALPPAGYPPPPAWQALPRKSYTSWIARFCAWLVDVLPILIGLGLWEAVAIGTGAIDCVTYDNGGVACTSTQSSSGDIAFGAFAGLSVAYGLWNWGYRQGTTGSSIGKSVMKFKVVSEKTWQPTGVGLSTVRQVTHLVDAIVCGIGFFFPLWDTKRQTLADKMMTTVCVPLNPQVLPPGPPQY